MKQEDVFSAGEGDAWFRRNASVLTPDGGHDWVLDLVSRLDARGKIHSVCEAGCANGWRLMRLPQILPGLQHRAGFDLSAEAVASGRAGEPALDLRVGALNAPPFDEQFDLVIVSFVLHWVDRSQLFRSLAGLDALVAPGGWLAIADFLPDLPSRRRYHHREDIVMHTYKQDYAAAFTASGLYREIARAVFGHSQRDGSLQAVGEGDRAACMLLHKPLDAYREQS